MAPRVDPVQSDSELPVRADVVVVGGGIIGTSTALFLARKGIPVVLCEKGHIAGEQSSRNWGWCRKMGRDPREIPLAIESAAPVAGDEHAHRSGDRVPPVRHRLSVQDADEMAKREAWLEHARPYQLDSRLLSRDEAAQVAARSHRRLAGRRSIRRATAAASRRRPPPRSPRPRGAMVPRSSRGAPYAASRPRPGASPPW